MFYKDGNKIELFDFVSVGVESYGRVVCIVEEGVYSTEYPKEDWEYLEKGLLIEAEAFGLLHVVEPDCDLVLIKRNRDHSA